jgi:hypothetical protein
MTSFKKTLAAAAAVLTLGVALTPAAEAKPWHHHGHRGGFLAAGLIGGALLGTAIASSNAYAASASDCYRVRERVWDDYRGRFVIVRRTVCE